MYSYLKGEENSIHDKAIYKIKITLPINYPYSRPEIRFIPPCPFHPNIGVTGYVCVNKYDTWNGNNYYIWDMLDYINYILYNPNPASCENWEAGDSFTKNL